MKEKVDRLKTIPWFVLILPLIPIANLAYLNIHLLNLWNIIRPLSLFIMFSALFTSLFSLIFRNVAKGSLFATALMITFFYYIDLLGLLYNIGLANEMVFKVLLLVLFFLFGALLWVKEKGWEKVVSHLNFASYVLIGMALVYSVRYITSTPNIDQKIDDRCLTFARECSQPEATCPDIYYFVLDGYGSQEMLADLYGFDNTEFINRLEGMGFHLPKKSVANYNQTILSLCASLNMDNLSEAIQALPEKSSDRRPVLKALTNNRLFSFLRRYGYQISVLDSGYSSTELHSGNQFLHDWHHPNDFEYHLLLKTPLYRSIQAWVVKSHLERITNGLKTIEKIEELRAPQLTFFHVIAPHPPFVVSSNGQPVIPEGALFSFSDGNHLIKNNKQRKQYLTGYIDKLQFLNALLLPTIKMIIEKSKERGRSVAILLQGDHGPGAYFNHERFKDTNLFERFSIFNAFYFDGQVIEFPAYITPANNFRLLLNHYFSASLPLVENHSFFTRWSFPYYLHPVEGLSWQKTPDNR